MDTALLRLRRRIGTRIRKRRIRLGLSRKILALHAGISVPQLRHLEGGRGNLTLLTQFNISNALKLHFAEFVRSSDACALAFVDPKGK